MLNGEFEFPKNFDKDAKDLVRKLLKVNPNERLGAGLKGSSIDMKSLKSHTFFKGKDFSNSNKSIPSISTLEEKFNLERYREQYKDFHVSPNLLEKSDSESSVQSMEFRSKSTAEADETLLQTS